MTPLHKSTTRDYLARVNDPDFPKAKAAELAKNWGFDYWDGDRRINYGGYNYMEGRWEPVARLMAEHYHLKPGDKVLDIGCGKGYLMYDLTKVVPGLDVRGFDVSRYAIENAKPEMRHLIDEGSAVALPYDDREFDFAYSLNTLHNLYSYELEPALRELERIAKKKYLCVESYRSEVEKVNLLYWQVTCEQFNTPKEWQWWFERCGYSGDHSFIYFE